MAFNQNKPAANGPLTSAEIRDNFQHLKNAIAKEHNWSDTDPNVVTHKGGRQMFTTNATFTVPNGVTKVYVTLCGGGGGGGVGGKYSGGGGGGGARVRILYPVTVVPYSNVDVIVGTGGVGGIGASHTVATDGGTSSFGQFVSVPGGGAGSAGGDILAGGASSGRETIFGIGGAAGAGGNGGGAGMGFGSGGGGGGETNSSSAYSDGGNGAPGMVIVEWYN